MRTAILLCAALVLGGCYNPKYPSETPGTDRTDRQSANTVSNNAGDRVEVTSDRRIERR